MSPGSAQPCYEFVPLLRHRPIPRRTKRYASRRDGWDGRKRKAHATRKADSVGQRVDNVVVIEDSQIVDAEASAGFVKVHLDGVIVHADHPEQVVRVDMHVEVVNLFGDVGRSSRTGIEVKSNKGERALMTAAVRTDEVPLLKPLSARKARGVGMPVTVSMPVPPPWIFVKPTNPSKSVICDGS